MLGQADRLHKMCPLPVVDQCRRELLAGNVGIQRCLLLMQELQRRDQLEEQARGKTLTSAFRLASIKVKKGYTLQWGVQSCVVPYACKVAPGPLSCVCVARVACTRCW